MVVVPDDREFFFLAIGSDGGWFHVRLFENI
jgi:hypothetical protein